MSSGLWRLSAGMGMADLRHEPMAFMFQVLALAAVLSPLLILYGLKYGVISTLTRQLAADPSVRQIQLIGSGSYTQAWFDELANDANVGFLAPHTRVLSATLDFAQANNNKLVTGTVLASGSGDPLLSAGVSAPTAQQAVLSAQLATSLQIKRGEKLTLIVDRISDGREEVVKLELSVAAVLPVGHWETLGALIHVDTLTALEQWGEGFAVPELGWQGRSAPVQRVYPTFRLYAANLDAVRPLAEHLSAQGLRVRTELQRIETIRHFDRSLGLIFIIIAVVAGVGFLFSFAANLWANVLRKRHQLSILRLQGMLRRPAVAFSITQSISIALVGWGIGTLLYMLAAMVINGVLDGGLMLAGQVCRLEWYHHVTGIVAVLLVALLASISSASQITRLKPAEGINHV